MCEVVHVVSGVCLWSEGVICVVNMVCMCIHM
jgi:hypothetical protein